MKKENMLKLLHEVKSMQSSVVNVAAAAAATVSIMSDSVRTP